MEEVPGERVNSRRFFHAGFAYHLDVESVEVNNYRCASRTSLRCQGLAQVEGNEVILIRPHDKHSANPHIAQIARMRNDLLRLCRDTSDTFPEIYRKVSTEYSEEVITNVTLSSARKSMARERDRSRPVVPVDLRSLGLILRDYHLTRDIFQGIARGDRGSVALLFGKNSMMELLNQSKAIIVHSTFNVSPGRPRHFKILTIFVRTIGADLPVIYVVLNRKCESLFNAVLQLILDLVPLMRRSLTNIICDYNRRVVRALRRFFPQVNIEGNWFYYRQALYLKWRELVITEVPRDSLWMAMALPLAPLIRFSEGLNEVINIGDIVAGTNPSVLQFFQYLRTSWLPIANLVIVPRASLCTHDIIECLHRYIASKLGSTHPNVWIFLEKLQTLIEDTETVWKDGRTFPRGRAQVQKREVTRISNFQDKLSTGRLSMEDFLRGIIEYHRQLILDADIGVNNDEGNLLDDNEVPTADDFSERAPTPMLVPTDDPAMNENVIANVEVVIREDIVNVDNNNGPAEATAPLVEEEPEDPAGAGTNNTTDAPPVMNNVLMRDDGSDNNETPNSDEEDIVLRLEDDTSDEIVIDLTLRPCACCLSQRPVILYHPCKHLATCESCNELLEHRICPVCRTPITHLTKVFYV